MVTDQKGVNMGFSLESVLRAFKKEPFGHRAAVRKLYQALNPQYHDEIQQVWEEQKKAHAKAKRVAGAKSPEGSSPA